MGVSSPSFFLLHLAIPNRKGVSVPQHIAQGKTKRRCLASRIHLLLPKKKEEEKEKKTNVKKNLCIKGARYD